MKGKNSHTSTLVHYTKSQTKLLSLLKQGFRFSYCKEVFPYKHKNTVVGIPMVSFCDIPINDCFEHTQKYGKYAIGLSKDSLLDCSEIKKNISPVHYFISEEQIQAAFQLMESTKRMKEEYIGMIDKEKHSLVLSMMAGNYHKVPQYSTEEVLNWTHHYMLTQQNLSAISHSIGMLKMHTLYIKRGNDSNPKRLVNYDECEWRVVLPEIWDIDGESFNWLWSEKEYDLWRGDKTKKKPMIKNECITFTPDCISFIILKEEREIPLFIEKLYKLSSLCGVPLSPNNHKLLCSKVVSFERIRKDF